jgi:hypothetical protein
MLLARAKIGSHASNREAAVSSAAIHDCLILTTWPEWVRSVCPGCRCDAT